MWNQTIKLKNPYDACNFNQCAPRYHGSKQELGILPVNVKESEKHYQLEFYTPGFDKSELKIREENGILFVSIVPNESNSAENRKIRSEFSKKPMARNIKIPKDVQVQQISAKFENGVLTIKLPKDENLNKTIHII